MSHSGNMESSGNGQEPIDRTDKLQINEASRKILRALSEASKKIDDYTRRCQSISQLFASQDILKLRAQLRNLTLKLLQSENGSKMALKTFELEWRKCFYEPISMAKRFRKSETEWVDNDRRLFYNHVLNGIGHYHNFLVWLESTFLTEDEKFGQLFDFSKVSLVGSISKYPKRVETWLEQIVYRCLMCLGDLTRYQLDLLNEDQKSALSSISQRYYHQALALCPNSGLPYNQLATLAVSKNFGLNTVFYYLQSMTVENMFDGAELNLRKFLDRQLVVKVTNCEENLDQRTQAILSFMKLIHETLFQSSMKSLSEVCQQTLKDIHQCLPVPQREEELLFQSPENFTEEVLSKMVLVLVCLMIRLQEKGEDKKLGMVRAFIFALFLHFVTKLLADLQFSLFGYESMVAILNKKEFETSLENCVSEEVNGNAEVENRSPKKKLTIADRLRRRKPRQADSQDSDSASETDDTDSSESEEESNTESESGSDDEIHQSGIMDSEEEENDFSSDSDIVIESQQEVISVNELSRKLREHKLGQSFRLCCLWLMSSPETLVDACSDTDILWIRLCHLFNTVNFRDQRNYTLNDQTADTISRCEKKFNEKPLPEDFQSRGIRVFENRQKLLNWNDQEALNAHDLGVYRLLQVSEFRDWLRKVSDVGLVVSETGMSSILPPNLKNQPEKKEENVDNKMSLMQSMAHLWLQQEVKDLEKETRAPGFSPYLVVDHLALIKHLPLVREIADSEKFAVIIPLAVVQELDTLKKTENGARTAIRWLESELKNGHHFLRSQKQEESKTLESAAYPAKHQKFLFKYFKVFECCNYFANLSGDSVSPVYLLTASVAGTGKGDMASDHPDENGLLPPTEVAEKFGILVTEVVEFAKKFKIKKPKFPRGRRSGAERKDGRPRRRRHRYEKG